MKNKKFIHVYMPVIEDSTLKTLVHRMKNKYGITALIVDYIKSNTKHALEAYANSAYLGKITDTIALQRYIYLESIILLFLFFQIINLL